MWGSKDEIDSEIDALLSDLERIGVDVRQFHRARAHMNKENLRNTLTQLLKAHVTQSVYREQMSDKFICEKCGRMEIADKGLIQTRFCPNCNNSMKFQSAM